MNKIVLSLACAVVLFAGCAKDIVVVPGETDSVRISVDASLTGVRQTTKAVWDGDGNAACVDHWIMEVYDKQGALYDRQEKDSQACLKDTFNVVLVKNQTYKFVFWADTKGMYDTESLMAVKSISQDAGRDCRDAFCCVKEYKSTKSETMTAELHRPFGQLNIVSNDTKRIFEDIGDIAEYAKFIPLDIKLTLTVYNQFDVLTNTLSDQRELTLNVAECYGKGDYDYKSHNDFTTLFMDYLFVGTEQEILDLDFTFKSNGEEIEHEFTSIPIQRNYRTNIIGDLLTDDAEWIVEIKPEWQAMPDDIE